MNGYDLLRTTRINRVIETLRDIRELPQELFALRRTATVNAAPGEILARYDNNPIIADIVNDDQEATTTTGGKITLEEAHVPNIKKGTQLTQAMVNTLASINRDGGLPGERGIFTDWMTDQLNQRLLGIDQRRNHMIFGMWRDDLDYDDNGIKVSNLSWGMPAECKIVPSAYFTDATNGKPVTVLRTARRDVREKYGQEYNQMLVSTYMWNLMTTTDEFRNQASLILNTQVTLTATNFSPLLQNQDFIRTLGERLFDGLEVRVLDDRYWYENKDGSTRSRRYFPDNEIILRNTADDNNEAAYDWANGIVTETIMASLPGVNLLGGFNGPRYGPVGYFTAKGDLNPPQGTIWAVARGFPRKRRLTSTAVVYGALTASSAAAA